MLYLSVSMLKIGLFVSF